MCSLLMFCSSEEEGKKNKKKQDSIISNTSGGFVAQRQLHLNASDLQTQSNAVERGAVLSFNKGSVSALI